MNKYNNIANSGYYYYMPFYNKSHKSFSLDLNTVNILSSSISFENLLVI